MAEPTKRCTKCGETKPADSKHYWKHKTTADRLQPMCIACKRLGMGKGTGTRSPARWRARLAAATSPEAIKNTALRALAPTDTKPTRKSGRDLLLEVLTERQQKKLYEVAIALALGTKLPADAAKPDKDLLKELFRATVGKSLADEPDDGPLLQFQRRFWEHAAGAEDAAGAGALGPVPLEPGGLHPPARPVALPPGDAAGWDGSAD